MTYTTTIWQEYEDEEAEETYEAEVDVELEFDPGDASVGDGGYFNVLSAKFSHNGEETKLSDRELSDLETEVAAYARDPRAYDEPLYDD